MNGSHEEAMKTMAAGLHQMFDIMVKTSAKGTLTVEEGLEMQRILNVSDLAENDEIASPTANRDPSTRGASTPVQNMQNGMLRIKKLGKMVRYYLKQQTGGSGEPVDQLKYIIKTFLLTLPSHSEGFPKRSIGDNVSHGAVKYAFHPLNTVVDGVVCFLPYMIFEINKERYVLSGYKTENPKTPGDVSIEAWLFRQDNYLEEVDHLSNQGWDWTFTDSVSEPESLMQQKLQYQKNIDWMEFEQVNRNSDVSAACATTADQCVNHVLNGSTNTTIMVRDIRYQGINMSIEEQSRELTSFEYMPEFPGFELA